MSAVPGDELERLAHLAALDLDEPTRSALARDVARLLAYADRLPRAANGASAPWTPPGAVPPLRSDSTDHPAAPDPRTFAPEFEDGFFKAPAPGRPRGA